LCRAGTGKSKTEMVKRGFIALNWLRQRHAGPL
jgi:hypothetical protein